MLIIGDDLVALSCQGQGSPEGQTTSYSGGSMRRDHWNWPLSHPCGFHLHLTHVKVVIPGLLNVFFITIDTRPSSRQEIPNLRTPQPGHLVHVDTQLELSQRKAMTELHVLLQILLSPDEPTDYTRCSRLTRPSTSLSRAPGQVAVRWDAISPSFFLIHLSSVSLLHVGPQVTESRKVARCGPSSIAPSQLRNETLWRCPWRTLGRVPGATSLAEGGNC